MFDKNLKKFRAFCSEIFAFFSIINLLFCDNFAFLRNRLKQPFASAFGRYQEFSVR